MTTTKSRGFTIIEVMIVLAIAGVIMLIIFQAIPTLTRNSRNSNRKHDVAAVLEAVSRYELNNSGNFPIQPVLPGDTDFLHYADVTFYDKVAHYAPPAPSGTDTGIYVYTNDKGDASSSAPAVTSKEIVVVHKFQKCKTDGSGSSIGAGAGYYDTVALYALETNSGVSSQCEKL